ncbi:MAG: tyrosine-type recombinase/integrase [Defluviitaleaceae bacterium]|nr:tyrosine-type recombinase/integrase [Defluviitaleaceae bacterium]
MESSISYRQKDGGWQYIIRYKEKGNWKRISKQGFKSKALAKEATKPALKELERQYELNATINTDLINITFEDFVMELIEHEKLYKQPNTVRAYRTFFNNFVALHEMPINKIKTLHIQKEVDRLSKEGFKASTIIRSCYTIKYFFNQAIEVYEIITTNPVKKIKFPAQKLEQNARIKALTELETETLLQQIEIGSPRYYPIFLLAVTTGLRVGEMLGLTWADIDFKVGIVDINKQWKKLPDSKYGFGSLKSKNSKRKIPVPSKTLAVLANSKREQVVISIDNRIIAVSYNSVVAAFRKNCKALNLDITIHDLRHTYATRLISNGVDFKTAAKLLGHDVKETMATYSHVNDDMLKRATDIIENIF